MRLKSILALVVTLASAMLAAAQPPRDVNEQGILDSIVLDGKKAAEAKAAKDPALKALLAKHPLVVLHSRQLAGSVYLRSTYSFLYETSEAKKHGNDVQLQFGNGGGSTFTINMVTNQQNLIADLGKTDFANNPDPRKVDIDGDGENTWLPWCSAVEDHVYLERVRDLNGNKFYVVFKVIAVDVGARYVAFIWRQVPGGTVVKQKGRG